MNKIYFVKETPEVINLKFTAGTPSRTKVFDNSPLTVDVDEITYNIESITSTMRSLYKNLVTIEDADWTLINNSRTEPGSTIPSCSYNPDTIKIIYDSTEDITDKTIIEFQSDCGILSITGTPVTPPTDPEEPDLP